MTTAFLAQSAYAANSTQIRTPRSMEFDLFARITRQLRVAMEAKDFPKLVQALHENRRLWTLLATDLASDGNALPQTLRAQLFYLAEFSLRHGEDVLARRAEADALVEINTAVMRGLEGTGTAQ